MGNRNLGEGKRIPLSAGQEGIWLQDRMGAGAAYNIPVAFRLDGRVDETALVASVGHTVARHAAFRTLFLDDGEVHGVVLDDPPPLSFAAESVTDDALPGVLDALWHSPFDLTGDIPFRGRLLRLGAGHVLTFTVHHIVFDDWSMRIFLRELAAEYAARSAAPGRTDRAPEGRAADLAPYLRFLDRRHSRSGAPRRRQRVRCAELLDGVPERLELPRRGDRDLRRTTRSWRGESVGGALDTTTGAGLERLVRETGCTGFLVHLAAWSLLVSIYSGQHDIPVGTPVADRLTPGAEDVVGYFLNTVVVRTRVPGGATFRDVLEAARAAFFDSLENAEVPHEEVVRELASRRNDPSAPLFSVWFATDDRTEDGPADGFTLPGAEVTRIDVPVRTSKFELALFVSFEPEHTRFALEFDSEAYTRRTATAMAGHYASLLAQVAAEPDVPVSRLSLLSAEEVARLERWGTAPQAPGDPAAPPASGGPAPAPSRQPAHLAHAFDTVADAAPGDTAIEHAGGSVTYGELADRSRLFARHLTAAGVRKGESVGLALARSPDMVAALLGVLRTGAAYVPLDTAQPVSRLRHIAAGSGLTRIVADTSTAGTVRGLGAGLLMVPGTGEASGTAVGREAAEPAPAVSPAVSPHDVAYVTFTSGSTGKPKGIRVSHRAAWNLIGWQRQAHPSLGRGARTLQFASLSFDVSLQEIFGALTSGGILVLIDEDERDRVHDVMRLVRDRAVERLFLPAPALLEAVESAVAQGVVPTRLRTVVSGSEQLVVTGALRTFMERLPGARLHNEYGPSETHVATAYAAPADPRAWRTWLPVGRPVGGTEVRLLDPASRRVPAGCVGEVCLSGPGLADGYSRMPAATARAFVPDPFSREPGARMYRTGDLARHLPSGDLEFLGRRDSQVKIRGFRVELEEVRTVLEGSPYVAAGFVRSVQRGGEQAVVAYWTPSGQAVVDPDAEVAEEVLRHLHDGLPRYMVPAALLRVDAFPLTGNGKVDVARLPPVPEPGPLSAGSLSAGPSRDTPSAVPDDPLVRAVAAVMARVLGREAVGEDADFFALGGHSLTANRLVWTLAATEGVQVSLRSVFEGRTPVGIAARASRPDPVPAPRAPDGVRAAGPRLTALMEELGNADDHR